MEEKNIGQEKIAKPGVKKYNLPTSLLALVLAGGFAIMVPNLVMARREIDRMRSLPKIPDFALELARLRASTPAPAETPPAPTATPEPVETPAPIETPAPTENIPQDAKAFYQLGEDSYYKGDFGAAINNFKKAVELDPNYADAYCEMGVSYMEKNDWDTATAELKKCIEIDPAHPKAQYAIAVSYARKPSPDVKAAREHFEISKKLGFVYPEWFEDFLKRLESGESFPGQEGAQQ